MHIRSEKLTHLIEILKNHYKQNFNWVELVILYGSLKLSRDIDLLIVLNQKIGNEIHYLRFSIGKSGPIDGIGISKKILKEKLNLLDIVYTEPILSGKTIYGKPKLFQTLQNNLSLIKPSRKIQKYLLREGINCLCNAKIFFEKHGVEFKGRDFASNYIKLGLENLSFAASYLAFSKYYTHSQKVTTFRKIFNKELWLQDIYLYYKKILYEKTEFSFNTALEFIKKLKRVFSEVRR